MVPARVVAKKGDVIFVNRGLYKHYGIYNNDTSVIHFSPDRGKEINPENAYIRETSLPEFLKDGRLEIDKTISAVFPPKEIVRRALCLVGSNRREYNLIFNNCEHFAHWCATDDLKSKQVISGAVIAGSIAITVTAAALILKNLLDNKEDNNGLL